MSIGNNKNSHISLALLLIAAIGLIDCWIDEPVTFGFLYIFPILLLGTVCRRWQVVAAALGCSVLTALSSPLQFTQLVWILQNLLVAGSLTGAGIFTLELTASRHREKEARQKVSFQTALLGQVNDAIVALDADFRIRYWNKAAERQFEWTAEELLGKIYKDAVQTAISEPERQSIHKEILEHGHWRGALPCRKRSGELIVLEVSVSSFRDENGNLAIVGIHRDVTERRRAEAQLAASEQRFKLVESALAIGTWVKDLETGRSTCSEQMLRLLGITDQREGFGGKEFLQHVHPEDRERVWDQIQTAAQSGTAAERHFRVVWPDGSVHWIFSKSQVTLDAQGRPDRIVGLDFDETEQVFAREQLRLLSSAVEQSPVSIVITDLHGNIEYVNRKTTEITGYSQEELVGCNPRILKSGETTPVEYRQLWETVRTGEWRGIFHNRKKNGELFWESAVVRPLLDSSGKPTHYLAVKEDITERKVMEAELNASHDRFRLITETIDEVFWMTDGQLSGTLYVSPAYEKVWGRSLESLCADPKSFFDSVHPDDRDRIIAEITSGIASQRPLENECRIVRPDGSARSIWNRGFPIFDHAGMLRSYVGIAMDTTEQKAAERANAELAAIIQSADCAIISKDRDGNVLTWNAGAERIFGYAAEEIIGHNIRRLLPAGRLQEEAAIHASFLQGDRTRQLETVRRTKCGSEITVLLTISPIRDRSNRVVGAAQVAWDITEQKVLQRQLAQAQKLESIGKLAAGIAHEINTPIQYVGDNAKFLEEAFQDLEKFLGRHGQIVEALRKSPDPDLAAELDQVLRKVDVDYLQGEVPKAIEQMSEGIGQVSRIVRAMKAFSHPGPIEKIPLDMNRAIESTILVSRNEWKYVADLSADLDPELPPVPCVAGEFNQVMLNLIVNAAHAIAEANKSTGKKGVIRISTRRRGGAVEVRVSDTGTGIPKEIQARVFDPFFTTKDVGQGTGQGLSIAYAVIVQKHQGALRFETTPGQGTTFIIQLPLELQAEAA